MKRPYVAPELEVEEYELSMSIASTCGIVVDSGPKMESIGMDGCDSYYESFDDDPMPASNDYNVNFYDGVCDCYTTGGSGNYWTS